MSPQTKELIFNASLLTAIGGAFIFSVWKNSKNEALEVIIHLFMVAAASLIPAWLIHLYSSQYAEQIGIFSGGGLKVDDHFSALGFYFGSFGFAAYLAYSLRHSHLVNKVKIDQLHLRSHCSIGDVDNFTTRLETYQSFSLKWVILTICAYGIWLGWFFLYPSTTNERLGATFGFHGLVVGVIFANYSFRREVTGRLLPFANLFSEKIKKVSESNK